ncbi:hypothetical protein N7448_004182 [Penicillium atrosanguineum]|nr:hypothetical protein N7448_004182 [Penicillium atrosanguineum]
MLSGLINTEDVIADMTSNLRQRPGLACEECRRRKARCDRVRPLCGGCAENGTLCLVNENRPQRGPKKGQLQALRSRVAMLERQLVGQSDSIDGSSTKARSTPATTPPSDDMFSLDQDEDFAMPESEPSNRVPLLARSDGKTPDLADLPDFQEIPELSPSFTHVDPFSSACMDWQTTSGLIASSVGTNTPIKQYDTTPFFVSNNLCLSALLYFDRVHAIAPIVHKQRYFSWALNQSPPPTPAQACLRSSMHTIAAAVSSQFRGIEEALYAETRGMLESLDTRPTPVSKKHRSRSASTNIQLEQIQSWLLLAQYEFLRKDEHQAMITAGRAFRLVQLARLFEVDSPMASFLGAGDLDDLNNLNDPSSPEGAPEPFSKTEEKRRIFWMAYGLDRFLSWRNEWPLTLDEETITYPDWDSCLTDTPQIHTRLPAPEANFQNNQPIQIDFLSDVLDGSGRSATITPFAECILLATLYGRCMSHRRSASSAVLSRGGCEPREFWARHESLAAAVEKRRQSIAQSFRSSTGNDDRNAATAPAPTSNLDLDPMLTFSYILAQSAIIYLSTTTETAMWQSVEHQLMALTYEQRAFQAAAELVRLAKLIPRIGRFKVHPFVPSALSRAVDFLNTHTKSPYMTGIDGEDVGASLGALFNALENLKDLNNLAREILDELEPESPTLGHEESHYLY